MPKKNLTIDERLDRIEKQIERMAVAMVKGFDEAAKDRQAIRDDMKQSLHLNLKLAY